MFRERVRRAGAVGIAVVGLFGIYLVLEQAQDNADALGVTQRQNAVLVGEVAAQRAQIAAQQRQIQTLGEALAELGVDPSSVQQDPSRPVVSPSPSGSSWVPQRQSGPGPGRTPASPGSPSSPGPPPPATRPCVLRVPLAGCAVR